jgi:phage protein D/phage baseplate assembly protein gpV
VVRAYDRSHRLQRGRRTRSFVQVTDEDIAKRIAREARLDPDIEAGGEVYDYVLQDNRTNYEFLQERAERSGFTFWVSDKRLHFRRLQSGSTQPILLEWGSNLQHFRPVLSASRQVDEVIVRGWDASAKRTITGRAARGQLYVQGDGQPAGSDAAHNAFGESQAILVHRPVNTRAEADLLAQAICDDLSSAYLEAAGQASGMPELCPGAAVDIQNAGKRFGGKYYVTRAVHFISNKSGYRTDFEASGRRAHLLLELMRPAPEDHSRIGIGVVTNNQDPDGQGRVKVKLPWLGDDIESTWARTVSPMAGGNRGLYFLPEVNDEVLVAFEQGDTRRGYVLGALWNSRDKPPEKAPVDSKGSVVKRVIRSRAGHTILLDDSQGSETVEISDKGGAHIVLNKSGIEMSKGAQKVKITSQAVTVNDGALEVK